MRRSVTATYPRSGVDIHMISISSPPSRGYRSTSWKQRGGMVMSVLALLFPLLLSAKHHSISATGRAGIEMTENDFRNISWKSDAGERLRRIYEWWRIVMNEKKTSLPYFQQAIRLVVLTQPSSASCERVFSQLTFIRRMVGDNILGEMLELRALLRCNNGLRDDYTV